MPSSPSEADLDTRNVSQSETYLASSRSGPNKARRALAPLAPGTSVGRYIVLGRLGRGGMGVVYAAYDPELDRRVAVKLLHTAADDQDVMAQAQARLIGEARAMARLTHANVVTAYDVGTVGDAVFVAMEFVAGKTLRVHLDAQWRADAATWRSVVDVYVSAGKGLAAAHAAGMVHRDFKPHNVMVADDGRVLVFDFGLAKPTSAALVDSQGTASGDGDSQQKSGASLSSFAPIHKVSTATGFTTGTPAYMSPEQMRGALVGPKSDQFSFCIALYEGLYDARPFAGRTLGELRRNVLAGRMREVLDKAGVPSWLHRIVERGLQGDPQLRYASMETLVAALERGRTRPARVRRMMSFGIGAVALSLATGAWVGQTDELCRDAAVALDDVWSSARAAAVQQTFQQMDNAYAKGAYPQLAPILDSYAAGWAAQRIDACRATRVRGEQSDHMMALRMACLDRRLHRLDGFVAVLLEADRAVVAESIAAAHDLPALESCADLDGLRQSVPPPEDIAVRREVDAIRLDLDQMLRVGGEARIDRLVEAVEELLARAERLGYAPIVGEVALIAADLHRKLGNYDVAAQLARRSVLIAEAYGADEALINGLLMLARFEAVALNEFDRARQLVARARAVLQRRGDPTDQRIALLTVRGNVARAARDWAAAVTHLEAVWALRLSAGQDRTPGAVNTLNTLCSLLVHQGRLEEAAALAEIALELGPKILGPSHSSLGDTLVTLGRLRYTQQRPREALELYDRAQRVLVATVGPDHPRVAALGNARGLAFMSLGETDAALTAFESALEGVRVLQGPEHLDVAAALNNIGNLLRAKGRFSEAIEQHELALEIVRARLGTRHASIALGYDNIAADHLAAGDYAASQELYERSLALFEGLEGAQGRHLAYPLTGIGMVHVALRQYALALPVLERAVRIDAAHGTRPDEAANAKFALAQVLLAQGESDRAASLARGAEQGWMLAVANRRELAQVRAWLKEHAP